MKLVDLERVHHTSNELFKYINHTTDVLRCLEGNGMSDSDAYEIIKTMRTQLRECDLKLNSLAGIPQ